MPIAFITTLDYTIDVDECHARVRTHHVHCAGQQKAAATRFHAELWWTWRHPCTSSVEPDIEIGERVIGASATVTPADGSGANECISGFETVIDPLAAQRWRIVGQDRFDVMLVVPNLAECLERLGDKTAVVAQYRRVLELTQDRELVDRARQRLSALTKEP